MNFWLNHGRFLLVGGLICTAIATAIALTHGVDFLKEHWVVVAAVFPSFLLLYILESTIPRPPGR